MNWLVCIVAISAGQLHEMSASEMDAYARAQADGIQSFESRLLQVARDSLGTPYEDGPLGEGPEGKHDTDPMVDFGKVDCVTYVEQSVALAAASSYEQMFANLQKIRYRDGKTDFENRNHFMISDWIANNAFCTDVSADLGVETETLTRTISRKDFFELVEAPGLGLDTPDEKITIDLVPTALAKTAQKNLPSPSLVVFVGKVDWIFSLHCGLYLRDEATGEGKLYHGSSKAEGVIAMDLADYMNQQSSRYIGFTAYRIDEPEFGPKGK